ncbi:MAG: ComF family protein [Candidatus Dormibacteria bacterium]
MAPLASLGRLLLDAVAPLHCAGCDEVTHAPICAACVAELRDLPLPRPVDTGSVRVLGGFTFDGLVREVLHRGKFQGNRAALARLGSLTADRLQLGSRRGPDAVVAVPLGRRRLRQRGYNQAEIVATLIAEASAARLLAGLRRERETQAQASRGEADRRANVAGAFAWRGTDLSGARIWLVDDVLTTGATINAAAVAIRDAGAALVGGVVVACVP